MISLIVLAEQEQEERLFGGLDWSEPRTSRAATTETAAEHCREHGTRRNAAVESRLLGNVGNTQQVRFKASYFHPYRH